jgi:adenylate cyclase
MPDMELPDGVREYLLAAGASEDEIDRVVDDDALFTLAGDIVRRRDIEWIRIEDVAATAGVSVEEVERYRLLVGLPARDNLIPEWTIYGLESYRVAASLIGDEVTRAWHRVLAASAATVATAATAMALNDGTPLLREMDLPPIDTLQLLEAMVNEMITRTPRAWHHLFRQHLLLSARRGRAEHEAELSRIAVAFVDLTDSTRWTEQVPRARHSAALSRFEDAAWSSASARGARLVKLIGDEAMMVATDPRQAFEAAADVCAMADADRDLPLARGAVGYGSVYARDGDYFGTLVNLVARAVKVARPGQLVVSPEVAASLDPAEFRLGRTEQHTLRGFEHAIELIPVEVPGPAPTTQ